MELVYLWVEDYKNIHEQGFNFSPRFDCDYDGKELTIKENNDYIENFFGDNINVTAIVGKNGSGKSSISEIFQALTIINPMFGKSEVNFNYILLFKIDKDKFNGINKNYILIKNIEIKNYNKSTIEEFDSLDEFIIPLFLDSELPYNQYNEYSMASNNFPAFPNFEAIKEFTYVDLDYSTISKKLLELETYDFSSIDFYPETITVQPDNKFLEKKKNFIIFDYHRRPRFDDYLMEKVDEIIEKITDAKDFFIFSLFLSNIDDFTQGNLNTILDNLKGDEDYIKKVLPHYLKDIDDDLSLCEYESILCEDKKIIEINKELLIKYFEYIDIQIYDDKKRNFFKLSHGEKMFFGIAINILYFIQSKKNESEDSDSYLFYFDEPDLSLHPNWQKQYIYQLLKLFKTFNKNIHFLFTTHSPFLLSDIPKQNIIFLDTYKKEDEEVKNGKQEVGNCKVLTHYKVLEKKQTFGANIHTLLSDSFFMEDGLMGEFAKGKIQSIKKFYELSKKLELRVNENEKTKKLAIKAFNRRKDKFEQIQKIIGEPFLQKIIKNYLDELEVLFSDDKTLIDKELAEIEERRVYLESLKKW